MEAASTLEEQQVKVKGIFNYWDIILFRAMQGEELGEVVHVGVVADFYCFVYLAVRCLLIDSLQLVLY